ncbi:MAG: sodium transporter, partial [Candidatus Aminicenantes bacterium]|nr:sodium transporter [Candidatus Aminicenantes bacterium]
MGSLDWAIVGAYILGVLGLGYLISRRQRDQADYYLAGRRLRSGQVGLSLVANQVSSVSLVGAPAFIALKSGGGLVWLQYELAVPLAMIVIIAVLLPAYWKKRGLTIYEYLEERFGRTTRSLLGLVFLVSRSLGSGVALLAASYVTSVCLGLSLSWTILLVGVVSLLYTSVGGIKADVYTDIVQLVILWGGSLACIVLLSGRTGSLSFPA